MWFAGSSCPVGWNLTLRADGTYEMGMETGTYRMVDGKIQFQGGYLSTWEGGTFSDDGIHLYFAIVIDGWGMNVDFGRSE
jgi:hypothetical protein